MIELKMMLQEAIEEVKRQEPTDVDWSPDVFSGMDYRCALAIATILNAVVKGELRAEEKQDPYWTTY